MTGPKAQDRMSPRAHRKTSRRTPRAGGCPERPPGRAGDHLLAGIDAALAALTSPTRPAALPLAENLRAALAHTAARGDTCRVPEAAAGVRHAADLLLAGSTEEAAQALRRARTGLAGDS